MKKKKTYRLLSIDASTTKTGWAYWEDGQLMEHGVITVPGKRAEDRIDGMGAQLIALIKEKRPHAVATECPYGQKGSRVLRILTELIGMIRGATVLTHGAYREYFPDQWRALTRAEGEPRRPKGRDEVKAWSIEKASRYTTDALCDDESDAILIGVAYMNEQKRS